MSRKASPALIGAFVVGALALGVVAVIALGAGRYFHKTYEYVLYFSRSVNGLRVGAPVKFRGVEVGSVKDIRLQLDSSLDVDRIPVIVEIDPAKITSRGYPSTILSDRRVFRNAIDRGLRGQLQLESFVTGVLFVALDLFPNTPVNLVQKTGTGRHRYWEIPTAPTSLDLARGALTRILTKLAETDFESLVDSVTRAVAGINQLVSSGELRGVMHQLGDAAASISKLATKLDGQVDSLAADVHLTATDARAAINRVDQVVGRTDATINDSPTLYQFDKTLEEISAAARSLRLLTDYLERNPRALLSGKVAGKEE